MKKVWPRREVSFRWFSAIVEGGECGGNLEEEEEMSKLGGFLAKPNFPLRILSFLFNWNPLDREINKLRKESNRIQLVFEPRSIKIDLILQKRFSLQLGVQSEARIMQKSYYI